MSFLVTDTAWGVGLGIVVVSVLLLLLIGWQEARAYRRDVGERARVRAEKARVERSFMGGEWQ